MNLRIAYSMAIMLAIVSTGLGQISSFTDEFDGPDLNPEWTLINATPQDGLVETGYYSLRGPIGNSSGLRRKMKGQGDFTTEISFKLKTFFLKGAGGSKSDLKIRFTGPGAWFEVVLNSFRSLRVTSSEIGGNLQAPINVRVIGDNDRLRFKFDYSEATSTMSVSYAINKSSWKSLASGSGVTPMALKYFEIVLFKFDKNPSTLPLILLERYKVLGPEPDPVPSGLTIMADKDDFKIIWPSVASKLYSIQQSYNLVNWETVVDQIPAAPPLNTYKFDGLNSKRRSFFRILEHNASTWPHRDYCAMLAQEIQGKKHAFLAGNLAYYIGGRYTTWDLLENETLGLTHPFHHDLRGRGLGIVTDEKTGTGHDFQGWEFYKDSKVAYGTVIVNGKSYINPAPRKMFWRPDRIVCEYEIDGVEIREEKFIALNDVACSIITSSKAIEIKFSGHSYVSTNRSIQRTSTVRHDKSHNMVHVIEGGTALTRPVEGKDVEGVLIYDGMSTVISTSKRFTDYNAFRDRDGRQQYSFKVACDQQGVALGWAMHDNYIDARERVNKVLLDSTKHLAAKTAHMDDLLTNQIPYFRCSDPDIVNIYYYLWSIYLMYYIDVGKGWEIYPHTQTAVNNFLGMHRFDANFQIKVGAWIRDKDYYAYGNVLIWSALLPYAKSGGRLPDNMGQSWLSPVWGTTTDHVIGAWDIYEHSGDLGFIEEVYEPYFKPLFWNGINNHWGARFDAVNCLKRMAILTGNSADLEHWHSVGDMNNHKNWVNNEWERAKPNYWGNTAPAIYPPGSKDRVLFWTGLAYMRNSWFPEDWARRMTDNWAVDSEIGFNGPIPPTLVAMQDFDHTFPSFASAPDLAYYSIIGMYDRNVGKNANVMGLGHLKKYNLKWGIPVAPESYDSDWEIWGDQYSNFNAGKILIILNGIAGLDYSIPGDTFIIKDKMPDEWSFMKVKVPVTKHGLTDWVEVQIDRRDIGDGVVEKTITATGNSLQTLKIQPWLEGRTLIKAPGGGDILAPTGHLSYTFKKAKDASVTIRSME
jgi:hypothetical protein